MGTWPSETAHPPHTVDSSSRPSGACIVSLQVLYRLSKKRLRCCVRRCSRRRGFQIGAAAAENFWRSNHTHTPGPGSASGLCVASLVLLVVVPDSV